MMITMISNWAVTQLHYKLDHSRLFTLLLLFIQKKPHLSQDLIYTLINLHKNS